MFAKRTLRELIARGAFDMQTPYRNRTLRIRILSFIFNLDLEKCRQFNMY